MIFMTVWCSWFAVIAAPYWGTGFVFATVLIVCTTTMISTTAAAVFIFSISSQSLLTVHNFIHCNVAKQIGSNSKTTYWRG